MRRPQAKAVHRKLSLRKLRIGHQLQFFDNTFQTVRTQALVSLTDRLCPW